MDRFARELQYVALSTAAAVILFRLTGEQTPGNRSERNMRLLNDVAHAISNVVPIYVAQLTSQADAEELHPVDLMLGSFARGARVFRMKDGKEIGDLCIQRRDMTAAIEVLKGAKVKFER